ncbi:MAG: hypothetical protein LBK56_00870 [Gracilibacteraceae bacterium]|nr:hypothetical protein [Gracilibacteraceae bacterium]
MDNSTVDLKKNMRRCLVLQLAAMVCYVMVIQGWPVPASHAAALLISFFGFFQLFKVMDMEQNPIALSVTFAFLYWLIGGCFWIPYLSSMIRNFFRYVVFV